MSGGSVLNELPEVIRLLEAARRLEEISVPSAAKLLKKKPEWVRANLPVIYHSARGQRIRLVDLEAYQARQTIWPKWLRKNGEA